VTARPDNVGAVETEAVACCVCGRPGRPVYDLNPLGVVRCPRCALVFVSPRPTPEALAGMYGDPSYHAGVYDSSRGARLLQQMWTGGRLALAAAELGRPVAGARLLEIGAGRGLFLAAARDEGFDVAGVELSAGAAEHARTRHGLEVHTGQLADAPLAGTFDVVCAWDTVEHVPDPVRFWRDVLARLAPGGAVLFSTPYFSSLPSRLLRERWWTLKPAEHLWQFTPATHRVVAAAGGLAVTAIHRSPFGRANLGRFDSLVGIGRAA
jgi:2-polyprenyl-3-methyl-5-hydroxy-6-metoxy-1,4-benzoquinol methylase